MGCEKGAQHHSCCFLPMMMLLVVLLVVTAGQTSASLLRASTTLSNDARTVSDSPMDPPPYSDADVARICVYFSRNFQENGAVAASPSRAEPDYWYHWTRDAALSMAQLMAVLEDGTCDSAAPEWDAQKLNGRLRAYVETWVPRAQFASDPNGGFAVQGEPKWFLDGRVYDGPWGRLQNDGPALRALVMTRYAVQLLNKGDTEGAQRVYGGPGLQSPGAKYDLEYVAHIWAEDTFGPWEEVKSQIFFVKMCIRRALLEGASLADSLNDGGAAEYYRQVAADIERNIDEVHWNEDKQIVMEVPSQLSGMEWRELDSASYLGALYGGMDDGFYSANSERMRSTVGAFVDAMTGYYEINDADDKGGVPGLLVGRYLKDVYNGTTNIYDPPGGNPWVLNTHALAEVFYRNAATVMTMTTLQGTGASIEVTEQSAGFWGNVMALAASADHGPLTPTTMTNLHSPDPSGAESHHGSHFNGSAIGAKEAANALIRSGDALVLRVKHHVGPGGLRMTEQIDKTSGEPVGATDLTWAYSTALGAMRARSYAIAKLLAHDVSSA